MKNFFMKNLCFSLLMGLVLMPHFSYADNDAENHVAAKHPHAQHAHLHSKSQYTQKVDINQANVDQLSTLKGVGGKKAKEIVAYRKEHGNFKTINDLTKVKGVGKKTLARLEKNNSGRIIVNKT